jgi:hypothetical protein
LSFRHIILSSIFALPLFRNHRNSPEVLDHVSYYTETEQILQAACHQLRTKEKEGKVAGEQHQHRD